MTTELVKFCRPNDSPGTSAILPAGCAASSRGLVLRESLTRDEWRTVGNAVCDLASASVWLLGDWLAFGLPRYHKTKKGEQVPPGFYEGVAMRTGYSSQTLKNAKSVCERLRIEQRVPGLTFSHAAEILGRAPEQIEFWVNKTVSEKLSVKALRVELRRSKAVQKPEANDVGVISFLEINRQFCRDYEAGKPTPLTPKMREELRKIHAELLRDLIGLNSCHTPAKKLVLTGSRWH